MSDPEDFLDHLPTQPKSSPVNSRANKHEEQSSRDPGNLISDPLNNVDELTSDGDGLDPGPISQKPENTIQPLFIKAQTLASSRKNITEFQKVMNEVGKRLEQFTPNQLAILVNILMGIDTYTHNEMDYMAHALIFTQRLTSFFESVVNIEQYRPVVAEYLKVQSAFYCITIDKGRMEIIGIYLDQKQPDVESLIGALSEHYEQIDQTKEVTQGKLYEYVFQRIYNHCFRFPPVNVQSKLLNCLIMSHNISEKMANSQFQSNKSIFAFDDLSLLDQKDLESYCSMIFHLTIGSSNTVQWLLESVVAWLLEQDKTVEQKALGLKFFCDLINRSKNKQYYWIKDMVLERLPKQVVVEMFLRYSTHTWIQEQLLCVMQFLYNNNCLDYNILVQLMQKALFSQEYFKVGQKIFSWLKLYHIIDVFEILRDHQSQSTSPFFTGFITSLVDNPNISPSSSKSRQDLTNPYTRYQNDYETNQREQYQRAEMLVHQLFIFLLQLTKEKQLIYLPILIKHIKNNCLLLHQELFTNILILLENKVVWALWILQESLNNGQNNILAKWQKKEIWKLILPILAIHRFQKTVVDKGLQIITFFCRFHRPLSKEIAQGLWNILGPTGRDNSQRDQFFVFLKQLLRFPKTVNEESISYIFFSVIITLETIWFTEIVYKCFFMLFLRLNQDFKLLKFQNQNDTLIIKNSNLLGYEKLWNIYFNVNYLAVKNQISQFLCKLVDDAKSEKQILNIFLIHLNQYFAIAYKVHQRNEYPDKVQILLMRGFQLLEKILRREKNGEEQKKEESITLYISNKTFESQNKDEQLFIFPISYTLRQMREQIVINLFPSFKSIDIICQNRVLQGQNIKLRELGLKNSDQITIASSYKKRPSPEDRRKIKQNHLIYLYDIFDSQISKQIINYVVDHHEDESLQTLVDFLTDYQRVLVIQKQLDKSISSKAKPQKNIKDNNKPQLSSILITLTPNLSILQICLNLAQNRDSYSAINKLISQSSLNQTVKLHIRNSDWLSLFSNPKMTKEQNICSVNLFKYILMKSPQQNNEIFKQKRLGEYLIRQIREVVMKNLDLDKYQHLLQTLLIWLDCPAITHYERFLSRQMTQVQQILSFLYQKPSASLRLDPQLTFLAAQLLQYISISKVSGIVSNLVAKVYIFQLYCNRQPCVIQAEHIICSLILFYGKSMLYISIITALYRSQGNFELSVHALSILDKLHKLSIKDKKHQEDLFLYIHCMFAASPRNLRIQQGISIINFLHIIREKINELTEKELISYIKLAIRLMKLYDLFNCPTIEVFEQFCLWLYRDYLFATENRLPNFDNKDVRRAAFELIEELAKNNKICKMIDKQTQQITKRDKNAKEVSKDLMIKQGKIRKKNKFVGLINLGSTCYLNSVIQQLYHTKLPKLILQQDISSNEKPIKMLEFKKLLMNLYKGVNQQVSTINLIHDLEIGGQRINPHRQQDANQFYIQIMHNIQSDLGNVGSSAIKETFMGTLSNQIYSLEDNSLLNRVAQSFLTLILDMKNKKNLGEALSAHFSPHILEGENSYLSETMDRKIRATSKLSLAGLPNILAITLKRFQWEFKQNRRFKVNDYFEFPLELNLASYTQQASHGQHSHLPEYRLCGILIHQGSAESGHYYSYIKVEDRWMEFNDKKVHEWDIQANLQSACFGGSEGNHSAYMLFYEKVNSNTHGCALHLLSLDNKVMQLVERQNKGLLFNCIGYDKDYNKFLINVAKLVPSNKAKKSFIYNMIYPSPNPPPKTKAKSNRPLLKIRIPDKADKFLQKIRIIPDETDQFLQKMRILDKTDKTDKTDQFLQKIRIPDETDQFLEQISISDKKDDFNKAKTPVLTSEYKNRDPQEQDLLQRGKQFEEMMRELERKNGL